MQKIDNNQDILDVRDIIARYEELETEINDAMDAAGDNWDNNEEVRGDLTRDEFRAEYVDINLRDECDEWTNLGALLAVLCGNGGDEQWRGDWYPVKLIRDTYFVEAMQDMVSDIGDLPRDIPAYLAIDWEKTADNLRVDYTSVDYDGVEYCFR